MPVEHGYTTKNGKKFGFYRWGKTGKMYLHKPNSERSRNASHAKAARQGRAIKMRQGKAKYKREMRPGSAEENEYVTDLMKKYGKQKK